jgi:hypothetical protein
MPPVYILQNPMTFNNNIMRNIVARNKIEIERLRKV